MAQMQVEGLDISLTLSRKPVEAIKHFVEKHIVSLLLIVLLGISLLSFVYYYLNGVGLAYNDARSHLDIGRRVVEGLKPGFAQLGSVWLPLPHLLMVPTIWNDFMWHSGLSGALQSMISFAATGFLIYQFLKKIGVDLVGRLIGVLVLVVNINILYLQATAMTELLLLATMTAGVYELVQWHKNDQLFSLIKAAFWIMLSTLIRYDGWFLLLFSSALVFVHTFRRKGYKTAEGVTILFGTLAAVGIFLWFLWNQLIFDDALYFAFGPYSARTQQAQLEQAGILITKGNLLYSLKIYFYAMAYNSGTFTLLLGMFGALLFWLDKKVAPSIRFASTALIAPFFFNILALYLGHSVLFVQGLSGNSWFNVRYGIMLIPSIAIFIGYLVYRLRSLRIVLIGLFLFVTAFSIMNGDAVTIDDARVGSSGKNVSEVSGWLKNNAANTKGFVLISVASHDAIIFSSGLPMSRFIHEGTGAYWDEATTHPDKWARYIILRTHDMNDLTYKMISKRPEFKKYKLVKSYPFADIYVLDNKYLGSLQTKPVVFTQR